MSSNKFRAAFLASRSTIDYVYGAERERSIADRTNLLHPNSTIDPSIFSDGAVVRFETDVIFSTWGMPILDRESWDRHFPNLKAVFYAAGSIQGWGRPLLERGVAVVSAWRANAVSVAQFTVAQIFLGMKGYFRNVQEYDGSEETFRAAGKGRGAYGATVSLLGAGAIGRLVIDLLKPYDVKIIVWDPFLDSAAAASLGVEKVADITTAFERGYVVSNHLADKDETAGLIDSSVLERLCYGATFVNTGRGRTVNESDLVDLLKQRPDITALLDVTYPEPYSAAHAFNALANAHVSTHIAGAINDEVHRMADLCIREFDRYVAGTPLRHAVTLEQLDSMA